MLLIHEVVAALAAKNPGNIEFKSRVSMAATCRMHLEGIERSTGIDPGEVLGCGLWLDGVCCKWDRSETLEMACLSFPGLPGKWANLRIPLFGIKAAWVMKHNTIDDLLAVQKESLKAAILNVHWIKRPDGTLCEYIYIYIYIYIFVQIYYSTTILIY